MGGWAGWVASINCNMQDAFEVLDHGCELPMMPMVLTERLVLQYDRPWLEQQPAAVVSADVPMPPSPSRPLVSAAALPLYVPMPATPPSRPPSPVVVVPADVPMPASYSSGADVPMPASSSSGAGMPMPASSSSGRVILQPTSKARVHPPPPAPATSPARVHFELAWTPLHTAINDQRCSPLQYDCQLAFAILHV